METGLLLIQLLLPLAAAVLFVVCKPLRREENRSLRWGYVTVVTALNLLLSCLLAARGGGALTILAMTDKLTLRVAVDGIGAMFLVLTAVMWLLSALYAREYMKHEERESEYLTFFLFALFALNGVCLSGSLITMYLFYECMTLVTFPLVLHTRTKEAVAAAFKYLFYSIAGAFCALLGFFFLNSYTSTFTFAAGGTLDFARLAGNEGTLLVAVFLMLLGFGSKAGLLPLHAWLPAAHPVAPSPASALLSGNVTKIGVLAIIRVLYYSVGPDFVRGTWVQTALLIIALLTVFMGSMLAYKEGGLKKRLAYSTVSQVSYALFGLFLLNETGFLGACLHIIFHSIAKNGLFLAAGIVIYRTGKTRVKELVGLGKRMPVTFWCFTLLSITLIGIPPTSAFLSKWYLALGSLASSYSVLSWLGPVVLLISALLTAGYLLPLTIQGFFPGSSEEQREAVSVQAAAALQAAAEPRTSAAAQAEPSTPVAAQAEPIAPASLESAPTMLVPLVLLTAASILFGLFPNALLRLLETIAGTLF